MRKKTRNPILKERCPMCYLYDSVGDQGYGRFFCSSCCVEFKKTEYNNGFAKVEIFSIDIDGKHNNVATFVEKDNREYSIEEYNKIKNKHKK